MRETLKIQNSKTNLQECTHFKSVNWINWRNQVTFTCMAFFNVIMKILLGVGININKFLILCIKAMLIKLSWSVNIILKVWAFKKIIYSYVKFSKHKYLKNHTRFWCFKYSQWKNKYPTQTLKNGHWDKNLNIFQYGGKLVNILLKVWYEMFQVRKLKSYYYYFYFLLPT